MALRVRVGLGEHPVRARDERHAQALDRPAVTEPLHHHVQAVGARKRRDTQVRDHEPLRGGRDVVRVGAGHTRAQHVDPGLERPDLVEWEPRRGLLVKAALEDRLALPDHLRQELLEALALPRSECLQEIALLDGGYQVAIRHPQ